MIDRLAPARRPARAPVGEQRWRDLLFLHWPVDARRLRALVPASLELDLLDGVAYVGLVPFAMYGVRPRWLPRSLAFDFLETNVRAYVIANGEPGVYFFSLEAASRLAVWAARRGFSLPYHHARMSLAREGERIRYHSRRTRGGMGLDVEYRIGAPLGPSTPGGAQHFLLERYLLFVERRGGLWRGQVHHAPYAAAAVEELRVEEDLVAAAGLDRPAGAPAYQHYSSGVDVEVFGLERVGE